MLAATEDELNEYVSSVLNDIKQKLMVIDLINQLDIASGLKGLLIEGNIIMKRVIMVIDYKYTR